MKLPSKHRHLFLIACTLCAIAYIDGPRSIAIFFVLVIIDWTEFLFKPWRDEYVRRKYWADHTKRIQVREREGVHASDIIAELEHDPGYWGAGKSTAEAVGQLVTSAPEQFHVVVLPLPSPLA